MNSLREPQIYIEILSTKQTCNGHVILDQVISSFASKLKSSYLDKPFQITVSLCIKCAKVSLAHSVKVLFKIV